MGAAHWDPNLGWCTKLWFTKAAGVANSCFTKAAGEANSWFTKAPGEPNFLVHLRYSCQSIAPYSRQMPPPAIKIMLVLGSDTKTSGK